MPPTDRELYAEGPDFARFAGRRATCGRGHGVGVRVQSPLGARSDFELVCVTFSGIDFL